MLLHAIGQLVLDEAIADAKLRQSIYLSIPPKKLRAAIEEAKTLGKPNGYYDFLDDHYSYIRQFAPQFLAALPFTSHAEDDPLLEAVETLRQLRDGAEIMSRFIPACMIALAREYFSISLTH